MDSWLLIAAVLALHPAEIEAPVFVHPQLWAATQEVGRLMELAGPNEYWSYDYNADLHWLRTATRDCWDAPPLTDCQRLPSYELCQGRLAFNKERLDWLEAQKPIYPHRFDSYQNACNDCRRLAYPWELMQTAQHATDGWASRRIRLKKLRDAIGYNAYYSSDWPPWVPD